MQNTLPIPLSLSVLQLMSRTTPAPPGIPSLLSGKKSLPLLTVS